MDMLHVRVCVPWITRSPGEVFVFSEELTQEWDDIEFIMESGASATVVGDAIVRAVRATDPNPDANDRLADGSTTQQGLLTLRGSNGGRLQESAEGVCDRRGSTSAQRGTDCAEWFQGGILLSRQLC